MQFKNFELSAEPVFSRVYCPKHGNQMLEIDNGWLSSAWYCGECKKPYDLRLVVMKKWNEEGLKKQIERATQKSGK